ncbi:MAG: hypothetical protein ACOCYG_02960 [Spirochaetota bacterium]
MSKNHVVPSQPGSDRSITARLPTDVDTGRKFLQIGRSNLFVSERGAEEVQKIDLIERNTQRVDVVDGRAAYERVKSHLNWAFTFQLFNLLIYQNDAAQSFSAYIHDARDLHSVFTHIEKDIDAGHDFFKYSVQNVFNLKRSRRMKSSL